MSASNVNVVSSTEITAFITIAANALLGPQALEVIIPNGNAELPYYFNVSPTIPAGTTLQVSIVGINFVPGATVTVNNQDVSVLNVNIVSATQIQATFLISANAIIGPGWSVTVEEGGMAETSFAIYPPPVIGVTTASLAFSYVQGNALPPSQSLGVLSNGVPVGYSVSASSRPGNWLAASSLTGQTAGNVAVSLQNVPSLSPGNYQGTVTIGPQGSSAPAQAVTVSLVVTGSQPHLSVSKSDLRFRLLRVAPPLRVSFESSMMEVAP